jgi:hypothetical protein
LARHIYGLIYSILKNYPINLACEIQDTKNTKFLSKIIPLQNFSPIQAYQVLKNNHKTVLSLLNSYHHLSYLIKPKLSDFPLSKKEKKNFKFQISIMGSSTLTSPNSKSKTPVLLEDGSYRFFWFDERIWASVLLIVFGGLYYGMPYQWNWKNYQTERKDDPFGCANLFFSVIMTLFGVIVGFFGCTPILRQYSVNENVYPFSKNLSKNFISLLNVTQGVIYIAAVIFGLIAWMFSYVSQFYLVDRNAEGPWLIAKSIFLGPAVCLLLVSAIRQFGSIESRNVAAQATLYSENTTTTSSIRTFFADPRFYWLLLSIMYPIAPLVETADWLNSTIEAKNIVFWFFTGLGLLCVIPMIYFIFAPSHRTREHISTPTTDSSSPPSVKHSYLSPLNVQCYMTLQLLMIIPMALVKVFGSSFMFLFSLRLVY